MVKRIKNSNKSNQLGRFPRCSFVLEEPSTNEHRHKTPVIAGVSEQGNYASNHHTIYHFIGNLV